MLYSGLKVGLITITALFCSISFAAEQESDQQQVQLIAPGYGELDFTAPEAGSYTLPAFGSAHDAKVLNVDGQYVNYHDLFKGKYTLLSFMYSRCNDLNGCPLTQIVFNRIKQEASKTPGLSNKMQLVSMSFDPENDTPAVLKAVSGGAHDEHAGHGGHDQHKGHQGHTMSKEQKMSWTYLTADSLKTLYPILDNYGQSIQTRISDDGTETETFSHIMRVFLIDPELKIRNIYSVSFLHPDIILNDVKTLLLEEDKTLPLIEEISSTNSAVRVGPGDNKNNYGSADYSTSSLSITARKGTKTDLLKVLDTPPLGLPKIPVPADNPITFDKVELGKKLFFDRRLSLNDTNSCAMCHIPEQGFTNNELEKPLGFEGRVVRRNSPTIYNTAYLTALFHDGRESTLENQVWGPFLAPNEMAMPSIGKVIEKIEGMSDYNGLFEQAFDGKKTSVVTIGQALASYQRVLVSGNSDFDRWHYGKEQNAISETAQRGFNLFRGKAQCIACHTVSEKHALFTDNQLHNTGLGWNVSMGKEPESERILIAPGHYISVKYATKIKAGYKPVSDLGYYEITQDPADRWRYRTPSLRNIALTAPYMHDGSLNNLEQVVEFYNQGGFANETQSPLIKPLNLSQTEMSELIDFLKTLTGSNVADLIADAFTAPVGDTTKVEH
ncbi:MAG: SCO family protein [Piscirickettsiaceae bacterium]|nr:SCO family protein [Piscirickettsiaceae bacterium]